MIPFPVPRLRDSIRTVQHCRKGGHDDLPTIRGLVPLPWRAGRDPRPRHHLRIWRTGRYGSRRPPCPRAMEWTRRVAGVLDVDHADGDGSSDALHPVGSTTVKATVAPAGNLSRLGTERAHLRLRFVLARAFLNLNLLIFSRRSIVAITEGFSDSLRYTLLPNFSFKGVKNSSAQEGENV